MSLSTQFKRLPGEPTRLQTSSQSLMTSSPWWSGLPNTCTTAFPGSLALLWLPLQPFHNPLKVLQVSVPFFSLFLVIFTLMISKFPSTNDPQMFISGKSTCSKANSLSSISNQAHTHFLYFSVHGIAILSTFQAGNLSVTLYFHLAPQHSIPQIRSSLFSSHFDNSRGLLPVSPTNSVLQTSPPEALLWSWLTPTIRTLKLQHAGAPASFLVFSSSRTNYTFSRERKGKLSKRTEWSAQEKSKCKSHICPQWINVLGEKI